MFTSKMCLYRVQPLNSYAPYVGQRVLAFDDVTKKHAYVDGWYGESCYLYELEGEAEFYQKENVMLSADPDVFVDVLVWWIRVESVVRKEVVE